MLAPSWRRGIVVARDGHRVKVKFPDLDNLVSTWFPVAHSLTLGAKIYHLPRLSSQVVVLMDEHGEDGVVIGGIYSSVDTPPDCGAGAIHYEIEDGAKFAIDEGEITLDTPGEIAATASTVSIQATQTDISGSVGITGMLTVTPDAMIGGTSYLALVATVAALSARVTALEARPVAPTIETPSGQSVDAADVLGALSLGV